MSQLLGDEPTAVDARLQLFDGVHQMVGTDDLPEFGQHEIAVRVFRDVVGVGVFDDAPQQFGVRQIEERRHHQQRQIRMISPQLFAEQKHVVVPGVDIGDDDVEVLAFEQRHRLLAAGDQSQGKLRSLEKIRQRQTHQFVTTCQQHPERLAVRGIHNIAGFFQCSHFLNALYRFPFPRSRRLRRQTRPGLQY